MINNKKGFFAISIIFSFFIVFLMIVVINLTSFAENRILMGQVKNDIKADLECSGTYDDGTFIPDVGTDCKLLIADPTNGATTDNTTPDTPDTQESSGT